MNMISRKIEERNEKIVRGLLKLPPNRRCINCDSLGPQYVCTDFWTFICTTCSGIHREFTHRVKSISMSKFTTQEVEALQNGGNQRARELYLKGWDFQRQRLPDSSNVDRIREFIKNVYVNKKYMSGKISGAPSTDSQSPRIHEDHMRASSYHSYSQSPPYDYQYEERKYGKRAPILTRKPGSERNLHEENVSSFIYSPTRIGDHAKQSRYMNEGSISRHSSHSESSGGNPSRSGNMSPSSYSNHGFNSPSAQASMEWKATFMEEDTRRDVNKAPQPHRTPSSGSFGSYDGNSVPSYSYNSSSQVHSVPEHDQSVVAHHNDLLAVSSMEKHSSDGSSGTLDLFSDHVVSQPRASSTADIFQLPKTFIHDLSRPSTLGATLTTGSFQSSKTSPPSLDFFGDNSQDLLHVTNLEKSSPELNMEKNEGWATFDSLPLSSTHRIPLMNIPCTSDTVSKGNTFSVSPSTEKTHYEPLQGDSMSQIQINIEAAGPCPLAPSPWGDSMHHQTFNSATASQSWNAFEDATRCTQWKSIPQRVEPHLALSMPSLDACQSMNLVIMEGPKGNATEVCMSDNGPPGFGLCQHTSSGLYPDQQCYTAKYSNPFDLPFDSDPDPNKEILNMNSLGAELPSYQVQTAFPDEFVDPWLSQLTMTTLPASTVQASLPYLLGQSQTTQFTDVSPHNTLAPIGGNPFA